MQGAADADVVDRGTPDEAVASISRWRSAAAVARFAVHYARGGRTSDANAGAGAPREDADPPREDADPPNVRSASTAGAGQQHGIPAASGVGNSAALGNPEVQHHGLVLEMGAAPSMRGLLGATPVATTEPAAGDEQQQHHDVSMHTERT